MNEDQAIYDREMRERDELNADCAALAVMPSREKTRSLILKLERARWWLISQQPFYGALAMRLPDKLTGCPNQTACTDGRSIFWHPPFLESLTDEQTRGVLMHETLHNAHGHFWRMDPKDPDAQEACDHAINLTLAGIAGVSLPHGCFQDPRFANMAEEEILHAIKRDKKPDPKGNQQAPGGGVNGSGQGGVIQDPGRCGGFDTPPTPNDKPAQTPAQQSQAKEIMRHEWERAVIQAVQTAKLQSRGDLPGIFARLASEFTKPSPIDWRQETSEFLKSAVGTRNDWNRSARRHAWQPVIYPRKQRDAVGLIVAVRDTSGSIDDSTLAQFNAVIQSAQAELGCELVLIDCDCAIQAERRIAPGEPIPDSAAGGGETDLRPPFTRAAELAAAGETIAGLVYLTDLYGPEPDAVDFPTLWLLTNAGTAKTGRTVQIV